MALFEYGWEMLDDDNPTESVKAGLCKGKQGPYKDAGVMFLHWYGPVVICNFVTTIGDKAVFNHYNLSCGTTVKESANSNEDNQFV